MGPRPHGRAAPLVVALVVVPALAGCGSAMPRPASPGATFGALRSQLAVLRVPAAGPDRPPRGSVLVGLRGLRRIGPRNVDGVVPWLYVEPVNGQVCTESDTDPPSRAALSSICLSASGLDDPRQFRVADSGRRRDEVTYGLGRDGRGCAVLRLEDGTVRRTPIVRNGWARRTPLGNPVVSVSETRSGCRAGRDARAGRTPPGVRTARVTGAAVSSSGPFALLSDAESIHPSPWGQGIRWESGTDAQR